jgi:hypothetical protein
MSSFKLEKFGGMMPAWNDQYIPEGQASYARNCYLFSGALAGWRKPKLLRALTNSAAKFVYRIPAFSQTYADANLIFVAQVSQGDTIKIGEETYTFTATVTLAYDVLIGASAHDTAGNLYLALTLGGTAGVQYGVGCQTNPMIDVDHVQFGTFDFGTGDLPWVYVRAPDIGKAFNTTVVTESTSGTRLKWLSSPLSSLLDTITTYSGGLNTTFDPTLAASANWLEFEDRDTTVIRSPVVNDSFHRHYFASPSLPPMYNTYDRIVAGQSAWLLGLQPPGCAPGVDVVGGGDSGTIGPADLPASATTYNVTANHIVLAPITPDGAIQLDSISFVPFDSNDSVQFVGLLYSEFNGAPSELLNVSAISVGLTANTTAVAAFVNPTGLTRGVRYWIGILATSDITINLVDTGTTGRGAPATFTNGPPDVINTVSAGVFFQIWGNMTTQGVLTARSYTYTWVTEYNEESAPAPPTLVESGWSNGTWTVSLFTPPPDDMGVLRNITKKRLYRTISAVGGQTDYFYVAELDVNTETYVDSQSDDVVALNAILTSNTWFPPPEGLLGIYAMPNGMTVGFKENEIWFSESFRPHAWSPDNVITTEHPIVGMAVIGNAVVAATAGKPYVLTGTRPDQMASQKIDFNEPCTSRRSCISTPHGVFYSSANGLILVKADGSALNYTESWITRQKWQQLTPPKYLTAIYLSSTYFCYSTIESGDNSLAQQGFTIELSSTDGQSFTIWPHPGGHRIGFQQMNAPNGFDLDNLIIDPWTGIAFVVQDRSVYYFDFSDQNPDIMPYKWKSKMYHQNERKNYAAFRVYFDTPSTGIPAQSAARDESLVQPTLADGQYVIVRFYGDDVLVTTREVRTSGELLRVLSGFKVERWQVEIEGRVDITNVQIATSVKELRKI